MDPVCSTKFLLSRREALRLPCAALLAEITAHPAIDWTLISHRGVYSEKIAENTAASAEEAIRRGYWMMETDLRRSADGRIVIHHDSSFQRVCGVDRKVSQLTWPEIRNLRAVPGGERPLEFSEIASIAKGRIGLWLDIKEQTADRAFLSAIEEQLRQNQLLDRTIIGINPTATPFFRGRVTVAESIQTLFYESGKPKLAREAVLVEGLGFTLSGDSVRWGLDRGFRIVPFIGTTQYPNQDAVPPGAAVIRRLQSAGVTTFMIDSVFEPLFGKGATQPRKETKK